MTLSSCGREVGGDRSANCCKKKSAVHKNNLGIRFSIICYLVSQSIYSYVSNVPYMYMDEGKISLRPIYGSLI